MAKGKLRWMWSIFDREHKKEILSVPTPSTPLDEVIDTALRVKIDEALGHVSGLQAMIVRLHFGLDGGRPLKFTEIAQALSEARRYALTATEVNKEFHAALVVLYDERGLKEFADVNEWIADSISSSAVNSIARKDTKMKVIRSA